MTTHTPSAVTLVPYGADPLDALAQALITDLAERLPDLGSVHVLVPDAHCAPALRARLLRRAEEAGSPALLGPEILTWRSWARRFQPPGQAVISATARELTLVETLRAHQDIFPHANPWALAESLLQLFDELTLHQADVPADAGAFQRRLGQAYGLGARAPGGLGREAELVHTLWRAWHAQLDALGLVDPNTAYLAALHHALATLPAEARIYAAGITRLAPAERAWLVHMLDEGRAALVLHGQVGPEEGLHPDAVLGALHRRLGGYTWERAAAEAAEPDYSRFLDLCFDDGGPPLGERMAALGARLGRSPARPRLGVVAAGDTEEEARVVDVQIRRWLLAGKRRIGVVTDDRRLARRLRALLERAEVQLVDEAGWALSTTSAASALESWLRCVEEDFAHGPLLDLLKSPFMAADQDRDHHLATVYRLEQDIVRNENVARGLARYRFHLRSRRERLPGDRGQVYAPVAQLLDGLENAAAPLATWQDGNAHGPAAMLAALEESLRRLGLWASLAADEAGSRILEELRHLAAAVSEHGPALNWTEFRGWLGRTLERFNFAPRGQAGTVRLMSLSQSTLQRFDGLVMAGLSRDNLPGAGGGSPFFNNAVRRELGLPDSSGTSSERFYHFRRLLEAAPEVRLTYHHDANGEQLPSPWVALLQAAHELAWDDDLSDGTLLALARTPATEVLRGDQAPLPTPHRQPAPEITPQWFPAALSASAHQTLVDCPYQFYAAFCLGLRPPEAVREALEKNDYGHRVHRCLQAFHGDVAGLPGPFGQRLGPGNRAEAVACLEVISDAVFAQDVEENFVHHGWLHRWKASIPAYVDWQIAHGGQWQVTTVEQEAEVTVDGALTLKGRLDRIDQGTEGRCVIDYKTGSVPKRAEVASGEAVQLPHYALLAGESVAQTLYLRLDRGECDSKVGLSGEDLKALAEGTRLRLAAIREAVDQGALFPAWGDEKTCRYCPTQGLCRRQAWRGAAPAD